MKPKPARSYSLREIFRVPLWLFGLSIVGLVAALVGDGWPDVLSWLALAVPLWVTWRMWRAAVARARELNV